MYYTLYRYPLVFHPLIRLMTVSGVDFLVRSRVLYAPVTRLFWAAPIFSVIFVVAQPFAVCTTPACQLPVIPQFVRSGGGRRQIYMYWYWILSISFKSYPGIVTNLVMCSLKVLAANDT